MFKNAYVNFFVSCIIIASACFQSASGAQLPISITIPYQSGEFSLSFTKLNLYGAFQDTALFSNGVMIGSFFANPLPDYMPDKSCGVFIIKQTCTKSGFRFNSGISRREIFAGEDQAIGNPDTVWEAADRFPDSLSAFDTQKTDSSKVAGKWYFDRGFDGELYEYYGDLTYGNKNAILYVTSADNGQHIKFQLVSWTQQLNKYGDAYFVTSIKVKYAVDSAGNGKFIPGQGVIMDQLHSYGSGINRQTFAILNCKDGQSDINLQNRELYNLLGRRLLKFNRTIHQSKGMYILQTNK